MEASSRSSVGGGLWNNPRAAQYSKETQNLLRLMMEESKLTNLQRKQINKCLQNGAALPLTSGHAASAAAAPRPQPNTSKSVHKRLSGRPQRRTAESCRSGNSYVREKFCPSPTRDMEKEKRRLQSILATGEDEPSVMTLRHARANRAPRVQVVEKKGIDRYEQVLDEIEERRQFLADMASVGKDKLYAHIINTEISQRIRELTLLDKAEAPRTTCEEEEEEEEEEEAHCH